MNFWLLDAFPIFSKAYFVRAASIIVSKDIFEIFCGVSENYAPRKTGNLWNLGNLCLWGAYIGSFSSDYKYEYEIRHSRVFLAHAIARNSLVVVAPSSIGLLIDKSRGQKLKDFGI